VNSVAVYRRLQARERRERNFPGGIEFDDDIDLSFLSKSAGISRRASDTLPGVNERDMPELDAMLSRNGLRAILKSLRELCDSRHDPHGSDETFDTIESSEAWAEAASELESLVQRDKVNIA
jgi:hypothetical protein